MKKSPRDKAWEWFSRYYRLKNSNKEGFCVCYTCGVMKAWNDGMQTGHLLDGRNNAILLCEEAVRCQCVGCNMFKSGNKEVYIPKFIDEMGREAYDSLIRIKNTPVKRNKREWEELEAEYKQKARDIAEAKGITL